MPEATIPLNLSAINDRWNKMALRESRKDSNLDPRANTTRTPGSNKPDGSTAVKVHAK